MTVASKSFRVNWRVFDTPVLRNTVVDFASGNISSFQSWINACGSNDARKEIRRLRSFVGATKSGVATARTRARGRVRSFA